MKAKRKTSQWLFLPYRQAVVCIYTKTSQSLPEWDFWIIILVSLNNFNAYSTLKFVENIVFYVTNIIICIASRT